MALFNKKTNKQHSGEVFAALDIGSSKICCAIAHIKNKKSKDSQIKSTIKILGFGQQISRGIRNGNIVDIEQFEDSILNTLHTAEQSAGFSIGNVFVNLPTNLCKIYKVKNKTNISGRPIDDQHLRRLLNVDREIHIQTNQQVIHVFPLDYTLDTTENITDPRGMVGEELSCNICIVTAPIGLIRNLSACLGRCHLDIDGFVVGGYASALSTLVKDELTLGVTLLDMGGSTTTLSSFLDGKLIDITSFPLGGNHITNDIARVLSTPVSQAERLKNLYGTLLHTTEDEREMIVIPQLGEQNTGLQNNSVSKFYLSEIIRCRVEEIIDYSKRYMNTSKIDKVAYHRIVLTGGTSQLSGMREFATEVFGSQVRIAQPIDIIGSNDLIQTPIFSTAAGLLRFSVQKQEDQRHVNFINKREGKLQKITNWIRENF